MIFLKNGTEIFFNYRNMIKPIDWLFSKLYVNDPTYFYLSLTLFGFSVTMQRKVKK